MKFTISPYTYNIADSEVKRFSSAKAFAEAKIKELPSEGIDRDVLAEKLTEVYNELKPPKEKKQ